MPSHRGAERLRSANEPGEAWFVYGDGGGPLPPRGAAHSALSAPQHRSWELAPPRPCGPLPLAGASGRTVTGEASLSFGEFAELIGDASAFS